MFLSSFSKNSTTANVIKFRISLEVKKFFPKDGQPTIEALKQGVKICSKLTIKTLKRRQSRRFGVFIVNFEHISRLVLVFLLLTLSR